jgi:hypothetical protein
MQYKSDFAQNGVSWGWSEVTAVQRIGEVIADKKVLFFRYEELITILSQILGDVSVGADTISRGYRRFALWKRTSIDVDAPEFDLQQIAWHSDYPFAVKLIFIEWKK